jgi:hypothetical protein
VAQQIIAAETTDHLIGAVSGEAFGTAIPVHNPPLTIHKVDPVVHLIEQLFVQGVVHGSGSASRYAGGYVLVDTMFAPMMDEWRRAHRCDAPGSEICRAAKPT